MKPAGSMARWSTCHETRQAPRRFLRAQILRDQGDADSALREFRLLLYGYGGRAAAAEIQSWQAKAGLEAARLAEMQAEKASDADQKQSHQAAADKYYRYVAQQYGQTPEGATAARWADQHPAPVP